MCDVVKVILLVLNTDIHCVSKNCAKLFLSELRQISTNFDNFWQKDGKEAEIMRGALIFQSSVVTRIRWGGKWVHPT